MHPVFDNPICPWHGFALPPIMWTCEAALCAWVRQPANTWSNLGFFLVAVILFFKFLRSGRRVHALFSFIVFSVGVSSTLAHASLINMFGILDFAAQFLLVTACIVLNLRRLESIESISKSTILGICLFVASTLPVVFDLNYSVVTYIAIMIPAFILELRLFYKDRSFGVRRDLFLGIGCYSLAFLCFVLDSSKYVCDPHDHIFQLHALWHLLNALCVYFLSSYFSQFHYRFKGRLFWWLSQLV